MVTKKFLNNKEKIGEKILVYIKKKTRNISITVNLLERQILGYHRPTESETLGVELRNPCFNKSSR